MLNGPGRAYVERAGRLVEVDLGLDADAIARLGERIVMPLGLRLDRSSPIADARLADGSRVHAVLPPLAPDGPCLTIRRFAPRPVPLDGFGVGAEAGAFLEAAVRSGRNLLVAGGTSTGKTTLLNALSGAIDARERIVTIEETAELRLRQPHVVRLEARPANAEGVGAVGVRELVRCALRMRPDRIIVGEVRGGEALDMLQALNTGHDGSLSTVHANGTLDALRRLETLVLFAGVALPLPAVRSQIVSAIDGVVFVRRTANGTRRVDAIAEVEPGRTDAEPLVRTLFERRDGALVAVAEPDRPARRASDAGAAS
jgi:pilus assembly protein CpaF